MRLFTAICLALNGFWLSTAINEGWPAWMIVLFSVGITLGVLALANDQ